MIPQKIGINFKSPFRFHRKMTAVTSDNKASTQFCHIHTGSRQRQSNQNNDGPMTTGGKFLNYPYPAT